MVAGAPRKLQLARVGVADVLCAASTRWRFVDGGCSLMAEHQVVVLKTGVRFSSSALSVEQGKNNMTLKEKISEYFLGRNILKRLEEELSKRGGYSW